MKQLRKPQQYRLTLNPNALHAFAALMASQKPPRLGIAAGRPDGKYDVGISHAMLDQLQTHALPRENLSDTVLRVMSKESC